MKKIISFFLQLIINTFVIIVFLAILLVAIFFILSKTNNISIKETLSYVKSAIDVSSELTLDNTNQVYEYNYKDTSNIVDTNNNYYYTQLDDDISKRIYNELSKNISNLKKENYIIDFSTEFNTLLNTPSGQYKLNKSFQSALDAFFYDHPELFYIDITKISLKTEYNKFGPITTYKVSLSPTSGTNYLSDNFKTEQEVNIAISKIENIKNNLIKKLNNKNDYDNILAVHDTLVKSLEYYSAEETVNNTHNIYGAFVEKKAVCDGYAKAFKYILDSVGIECILVNGKATNSTGKTESHMWNYVKLKNNWYAVDVTWDDPVVIGGTSSNILINHNYFCKGRNLFNKSHFPSNKISNEGKYFSLPSLSDKNYK